MSNVFTLGHIFHINRKCLLSSQCLDNSIPTEPKSNNCETKLLILFLLCSSMQRNTFQSYFIWSVSFLKSAVTNVYIQICSMSHKNICSFLGRQQGELSSMLLWSVYILPLQLRPTLANSICPHCSESVSRFICRLQLGDKMNEWHLCLSFIFLMTLWPENYSYGNYQ